MKGMFEVNERVLMIQNLEYGANERVSHIRRSLGLMPLDYTVNQVQEDSETSFSVIPTGLNLNGFFKKELFSYGLIPKEEISFYGNESALGIVLVESSKDFLCVEFDNKQFTLYYSPKINYEDLIF